jgi:hypothetical protein
VERKKARKRICLLRIFSNGYLLANQQPMKKLTPIVSVLLLFILTVGSGSSCKKEVRPKKVTFDFLVPITVTPLKDTINVGEELTISTLSFLA